jgi:hypothetical protein
MPVCLFLIILLMSGDTESHATCGGFNGEGSYGYWLNLHQFFTNPLRKTVARKARKFLARI